MSLPHDPAPVTEIPYPAPNLNTDASDRPMIDAGEFKTIKRNGDLVEFRPEKIASAILGAYQEVRGEDVGRAVSTRRRVKRARRRVRSRRSRRLHRGPVVGSGPRFPSCPPFRSRSSRGPS